MKSAKNVSPTAEPQPKEPAMDKLARFLTRHRVPILVVVASIVVGVVALIAVLSIQNAREEAALIAVEDLQIELDEWLRLSDDDRAERYPALAGAASAIVDGYPRTYAAVRARIIDAQALADLERWAEAATRYAEVAEQRPRSYLAPVSLMDAAVAAENAGDTDRALELLGRIVERYGGESSMVPRALFSIGRIHEQRDEIADAAAAYRRLISGYPAGSWTNLARNRIISLTVEGRIGG